MAGWWAVGIDVGGTKIRSVLLGESGVVLAEDMRWTPSRSGPKAVLKAAAESALQVMGRPAVRMESDHPGERRAPGSSSARVRIVGVGIPGIVDSARGIGIRAGNLTGWQDVPVVQELERLLGLPVRTVNDVRAGAWGEWLQTPAGDAAPRRDQRPDTASSPFLYVSIGTGVASVLINDGKIYDGAAGAAGELGHTILDPNSDAVCPGCGQRGDVESLIAGPALRRAYEQALQSSGAPEVDEFATHPSTIFRLAGEGKQPAAAVVERYIRYLGIALANVIGLYNPRRLVLGGGLGTAPTLPLGDVLEQVRKHAYPLSWETVRVERAQLGDASGAVGAALWALDHDKDKERIVAR